MPFVPVSALVRQLSRLPGFVALSPMVIGELSRLVPELRERFPQAPQPMAIDDSARYRLCDATLRAAECVADEQPLLLVADDLQDADEATQALLHYFGRQAASQPTVLLGIHRTPSEDAEFDRAFVDTARSAGFARSLALGALAEEEIVRIVQHIFARRGLDASADLLTRLADAAAGNPLQAIELSLAIPAQEGRPEAAWLESLEGADGGEGGAFEQTADERLALLPEDARKVASVLALAGRPLTDYDLAAVTHLPPSALASALLALEAAQFVLRSETTLAFAHERYRARAETAVSGDGRRAVHRALARYLARSAAANPAARYEVASHYAGAGRPAEARTHAVAAARYAASIGAVRERSAALELARSVAEAYDGRLTADLGSCYLDLKEFDRLDALCAEADGRADLEPDLRDEFRYLAIAADHHAGRAPLRRVQTALEGLLAVTGPGFARDLDARNLLMRTADKTGDHRAVKRAARELRRRPVAGGPAPRSAHALFASAYVIAKYYWPERALPLLETASRLAQEEQNFGLEHMCRDGLGTVLKHLGRYDESIAQIQVGLALARKTLDPLAEAASLNNIANAEMARGRFDLAALIMEQSAKIEADYPRWPLRLYRYYNRGVLHLLTGQLHVAEADLGFALSQALAVDLWPIAVYSCGALGLCAVRQNHLAGLAGWREAVDETAAGRLAMLPERWTAEATIAWDTAVNRSRPSQALSRCGSVIGELRYRDVDSSLRLELEAIQMHETVSQKRMDAERTQLALRAASVGASAVKAAALNCGLKRTASS